MATAQEVMIITKEGLLLLQHTFRRASRSLIERDSDLVSGMISAIISVAKETGGGSVQTIQQDRYNVIVSEGEKVYGLLFINETSRELENIAKIIVKRFENKYANQLIAIIPDSITFEGFKEDLDEIYAQIFKVDAELLFRLIPAVTAIKNVSIFEKPMNHQVYSGPRDSFVSEHDLSFQELAVSIIESQEVFAEKTLEFPKRSILEYKNRVIVLEDLGSHVLMIIRSGSIENVLSIIKKIRKKVGI